MDTAERVWKKEWQLRDISLLNAMQTRNHASTEVGRRACRKPSRSKPGCLQHACGKSCRLLARLEAAQSEQFSKWIDMQLQKILLNMHQIMISKFGSHNFNKGWDVVRERHKGFIKQGGDVKYLTHYSSPGTNKVLFQFSVKDIKFLL